MASASLKLASDHTVADGTPLIDRPSETSETVRRIERLPTEVGVLLLSAGVTMGLTPPPPGPFDLSIMLSGGLILWPRASVPSMAGLADASRRHTGPVCSFSIATWTIWSVAIPTPPSVDRRRREHLKWMAEREHRECRLTVRAAGTRSIQATTVVPTALTGCEITMAFLMSLHFPRTVSLMRLGAWR